MYKQVQKCRLCGNPQLVDILDLGVQALTGVFPRTTTQPITAGPLVLTKCVDSPDSCGLVQLKHSYDLTEMYGENYGYRSGLNPSMVAHLHSKVRTLRKIVDLRPGDLVIDVGSNDGTTLAAYPPGLVQLVGVDPTGSKFREFYRPDIDLLPDFFSADLLRRSYSKKAKVVTSFSMFYDLESPLEFMGDVYDILHDDGVWMFEQSYMPAMLATNSFDTICHEHLEFYSLQQIHWAAEQVGFKIISVELNDVNGGSFSVVVAKKSSSHQANNAQVTAILHREQSERLDTLEPFKDFAGRISGVKQSLIGFMDDARRRGQSVYGLGASTKGNVLLQYCGFDVNDIPSIGEVNADKYGSFTPGTLIPIISEEELLAKHPDYLLVLPWHFRSFFVKNPKFSDRTLVFPLPQLEQVGARTSPGEA